MLKKITALTLIIITLLLNACVSQPEPAVPPTTPPPETTSAPTTAPSTAATTPPPTEPPTISTEPYPEATLIENFEYTVNDDGVTITKYIGKGIADIVIPAEIEGKSVTGIGTHGFWDIKENDNYIIKSVIIPDSVIYIGPFSFALNTSLESINIPQNITKIPYSAFSYCSSLTSITIPDGVIEIDETAFVHCVSLKNITIPESVIFIEDGAFYGCNSIPEETRKKILVINGKAFDYWEEFHYH